VSRAAATDGVVRLGRRVVADVFVASTTSLFVGLTVEFVREK
jgi:hypothetical protein